MKGSIAVALAAGALAVVAYGGFATAAEAEDPGDAVAAIVATAEPEEASGEEASGDAPSPGAPAEEPGLAAGSDRSAEVALVPRYLAHSDEFAGAEKGAAISAWAKTQANKKSDGGGR